MAIAPTGAIYKSLVFDGEDSRNYGVYITGEAVYNAPGRDVEMVEIPGRNGSFALDKGRFQNIEVSYPAGIFADNETDFAEAISDFRNFLCSRRGYVRLTDEYNPNEYRMAIYKSGLEVTPAQLKAGEFEIVFDCKPQRWLTSGEDAVTIGEWGETETASSDIVSVENPNGVLAVKSLEVDLEPIQSGSGTPSPTNVRPISGHTSVDVIVSPTTTASDGTTYTTALGRTVYGGTLDVVSGVLTVTHAMVDLGDKSWTMYSVTQGTLFRTVISDIKTIASTTDVLNAICENYASVSQANRANGTVSAGVGSGANNIDIIDNNYTSASNFKSGVSGVKLVYELATPQTYQLTAQQIELLQGTNNVWADSGDVSVEYGTSPNVLVNPTLFESSPLLESTGYGNILVNGEKITIGSLPYGKIIIANGITDEFRSPLVYTPTDIDVSRLNVGDTFVVKGMTVTTQTSLDDPLITSYEESITALTNCTGYVSGDGETWSLTMNDTQFVYGTSKTVNAQMAVEVKEIYNGNPVITTYTWDADIRYNGSSILYFEANRTFVGTIVSSTLSVEPIYANSTVLATNLTMFIDLDLGEAWNDDGDTIASLNNIVQFPAQLPTLKPGSNSISFDDTITSLKITPRWWKV